MVVFVFLYVLYVLPCKKFCLRMSVCLVCFFLLSVSSYCIVVVVAIVVVVFANFCIHWATSLDQHLLFW